jgi:hypothetical protein
MQAGVIRAAGGRAKGKVGERGRVRKGGAKDEKRKGRERIQGATGISREPGQSKDGEEKEG